MMKLASGIALCAWLAAAALAPSAQAQDAGATPLKIALIETLSGAQAATGALFLTAAEYEVGRLNEAGGYNGRPIELVPFDSQGTPTGASARVTEAVNGGAQIILQGASSAIAGQITEDVRKYNLRNPEKPVIYLNSAAEARELTGAKCHFYHFKFALDAELRLRGVAEAVKAGKVEARNVFAINQDYAWGRDIQSAVESNAAIAGYTVVGSVLHDLNRIQDFSPYVAQIAASGADTVITGNWGTDLLRLVRAASDANLDARFISMFMDLPGNVQGAGAAAEGQYNVEIFNAQASGETGLGLLRDFREKTGNQDLVSSHARTIFALQFLGEALKSVPPSDGAIDAEAIALALETTRLESAAGPISMRVGDHQAILPLVVTRVSKDAEVKVDGTPFGFEPVFQIPGEALSIPVQDDCRMKRPS